MLDPAANGLRFHLERFAPSAALAHLVERHWIVRWDLRDGEPYGSETLPHPTVNMVFERGCTAVHGVTTGRFTKVLSGAGFVVATKFRPGAFFPFVQRSMHELTDATWSLDEAFAIDGAALEREVFGLPDDASRIARVEAFLLDRLPLADPNVETVIRVVRAALEHHEVTRVEALVARVGIPERTLQRLFRRYVGVSAKWVIRRFRMHEAAERVAEGHVIEWAGLAHELGFCDQAHFINDFRAQVGCSPTEYAARCATRRADSARARLDAAE
jgi:AraC-like DNA-binding protein